MKRCIHAADVLRWGTRLTLGVVVLLATFQVAEAQPVPDRAERRRLNQRWKSKAQYYKKHPAALKRWEDTQERRTRNREAARDTCLHRLHRRQALLDSIGFRIRQVESDLLRLQRMEAAWHRQLAGQGMFTLELGIFGPETWPRYRFLLKDAACWSEVREGQHHLYWGRYPDSRSAHRARLALLEAGFEEVRLRRVSETARARLAADERALLQATLLQHRLRLDSLWRAFAHLKMPPAAVDFSTRAYVYGLELPPEPAVETSVDTAGVAPASLNSRAAEAGPSVALPDSALADSLSPEERNDPEAVLKRLRASGRMRELTNTGLGYRIQVFSGKRSPSKEVYAALKKAYPELKLYKFYEKPYFKIRAGNFKHRREAVEFCRILRADFPGAFVVPDRRTY